MLKKINRIAEISYPNQSKFCGIGPKKKIKGLESMRDKLKKKN